MDKITTIGFAEELKNAFHDKRRGVHGKVIIERRYCSEGILFTSPDVGVVGMEACESAHYWTRGLKILGWQMK
jgi:hypothetical protein